MRRLLPVVPPCAVVVVILICASSSWPQQIPLSPQAQNALDYYLNVDCAVEEKRQPLTQLLQFKRDVQSTLIDIARNCSDQTMPIAGARRCLDQKSLDKKRRTLEAQWARRESFLKKTPPLGLSKKDLEMVQAVTKDAYVQEGLNRLFRSYRNKAVVALVAIDSDEARKALAEVSAHDEDLRDLIEGARRKFHSSRQEQPPMRPMKSDSAAPTTAQNITVH